jgi:hypothetical protein
MRLEKQVIEKGGSMRAEKLNIQREAMLRFWTAMNHLDYDEVVSEYLGQADHQALMVSNKLYANVEAAIHFMNTQPSNTEEKK